MERLSKTWLAQDPVLPNDLCLPSMADYPERALQFGEGNFLRAFIDWMLNEEDLTHILQQGARQALQERLKT
ncbi:hypothetical protein ACFL6U_00270 [Planctomycetota bacterium]